MIISSAVAAMGVAGRKTKVGRAKHKPLLTLVYPKIGPSAVYFAGVINASTLAYCSAVGYANWRILSNLTGSIFH